MGKISVIIVDDHTLLRETWSLVLNSHPDFKVVAETGSGEEAIRLCKFHMPDIVMMDINLPGISGVEATTEVIRASPKTKVIGISLHSQPGYAKKMLKSGAVGYITKNSPRQEMIHGLLEVAKGKRYICNEIKNILSEEMLTQKKEKTLDDLSDREREVVKLLVTGASSKEIAKVMFISAKTVEVHRYNIMKKLELKNVAALVNFVNSQAI